MTITPTPEAPDWVDVVTQLLAVAGLAVAGAEYAVLYDRDNAAARLATLRSCAEAAAEALGLAPASGEEVTEDERFEATDGAAQRLFPRGRCSDCGAPEPGAKEGGATGKPTQADALRAAARLVETFGQPLYVSTSPRGIDIEPSYGTPKRADFDTLRALAQRYGAIPVDACALHGDAVYARAEFTIEVSGVPLRAMLQVGGGYADELVDEVRAWIAEAAS